MEESWERRNEFPLVDAAEIEAMLLPYSGGRKLHSLTALEGGLSNGNYAIQFAGLRTTYVLRIYAREKSVRAREAAILKRIGPYLNVPAIIHSGVDGLTSYAWTLMDYVPGYRLNTMLAMADKEECEQVAYSVGAELARIGNISFPCSGNPAADLTIAEPFPALDVWFLNSIREWVGGRCGKRLGPDLAGRTLQFAERKAPLLAALPERHVLVHGDYKPTNILVSNTTGAWRVTAVLDWEFCFAGSPLFDVGMMLRYEHELPESFAACFARGYTEAGGELTPDWRTCAALLDMMNLCSFLDQEQERPNLFRDVRALLVATLNNYT